MKYYWLKLKRDFFKRHDIRIISSLPDGRSIVLFYLELLCESIDHEGELRYSEKTPYNAEMLAMALRADKELTEKALKALKQYELIEIKDDGTIFLPELDNMLGYETEWARKKREWRGQQEDKKGQSEDNVLEMSSECPEMSDKSKSKSKSKSIERNIKERKFKKPTLEEISSYCQERKNSVDAQRFFDYYESKGWLVGKSPMKDWKAAVRNWERNDQTTSHCPAPKNNYEVDWGALGVKT